MNRRRWRPTDRQLLRGRNSLWGGWHVFYHLGSGGVKVCSSDQKQKATKEEEMKHSKHFRIKLVKCNERVNTIQ